MATRMQQRRGTAAQWLSTNAGKGPILSPGEIGFESDTNKFKVGDGVNHWIDLTYFVDADSSTGGGGGSISVQQVNAAGIPVDSYINVTTIQFDEDSGFDVTSPATGTAKIAMNSTFKFWEVNGVQQLTAVGLDTVNFISGAGIDITADGNADPQSISIAIDTTAIQAKVSGVSDTEIGYLDGVTSAIQTQLNDKATPADITTAINNLVDGAPAALNTLNELAAAINNDSSYAATITTALGNKIEASALEGYATESYVDTAVANSGGGGGSVDLSTAAGVGLDWNTATNQLDIDSAIITTLENKQDKVPGVEDTQIAYLNNVTAPIQTQINNKLDSSALPYSAGLGLDWNVLTSQFDLNINGVPLDFSSYAGVNINWNAATTQFDLNQNVATKNYVNNAIANGGGSGTAAESIHPFAMIG